MNRKIKYMYLRIAILLIQIFFIKWSFCQDYHISQFGSAPHYLNPALTGMYFGERCNYRINMNYHSQWKSLISKPITTMILGYDIPLTRFGAGAYIVNNNTISGYYNSFSLFLSGAYKITSYYTDKHFLLVGLQSGFFNKSINTADFLFDSQYYAPSGGLDPGISSGESFTDQGIINFDANMGIYYKYRDINKTLNPFCGFSIFHVTRPNESFTGYKSRLPMRFSLQGGSDIYFGEMLMLSPKCLYMYQNKATELNAGILGFYKLRNTNYELIFGLFYRNNDAIIVNMGMKRGLNMFRISYDINSSYLQYYSNKMGAVEFSLIFYGRNVTGPSFIYE